MNHQLSVEVSHRTRQEVKSNLGFQFQYKRPIAERWQDKGTQEELSGRWKILRERRISNRGRGDGETRLEKREGEKEIEDNTDRE